MNQSARLVNFSDDQEPIKIAIAGLSHDHVRWVLDRKNHRDIIISGIAETDKNLAAQYQKEYKLDENIFFTDLEEMLDTVRPQGVCAFNSIDEHVEVVRQCAPRKIHVMVEKPLAFKSVEAYEIQKLAAEHNIFVLTNFQTSWYASTYYIYDLAFKKEVLGDVWKVVFHDGHKGPVERGCSKEFVNWLTDPEKNGGGAIIDFGCYGPNIMTWMKNGEKPISVTAIKQTIKPTIYTDVDDEAVIILEYSQAQAVIQASWNWPVNRKDIEVYGKNGQIIAEDHQQARLKITEDSPEEISLSTPLHYPYDDPFSYFSAVIKGSVKMKDFDLSALPLNVVVVEILEAALISANSGQKVYLKKAES